MQKKNTILLRQSLTLYISTFWARTLISRILYLFSYNFTISHNQFSYLLVTFILSMFRRSTSMRCGCTGTRWRTTRATCRPRRVCTRPSASCSMATMPKSINFIPKSKHVVSLKSSCSLKDR